MYVSQMLHSRSHRMTSCPVLALVDCPETALTRIGILAGLDVEYESKMASRVP